MQEATGRNHQSKGHTNDEEGISNMSKGAKNEGSREVSLFGSKMFRRAIANARDAVLLTKRANEWSPVDDGKCLEP